MKICFKNSCWLFFDKFKLYVPLIIKEKKLDVTSWILNLNNILPNICEHSSFILLASGWELHWKSPEETAGLEKSLRRHRSAILAQSLLTWQGNREERLGAKMEDKGAVS